MGVVEQLRKAIEKAAEHESINGIAKAAGVPQPVLSRFLSGTQSSMSGDTIDALCKYLGLELTAKKKRPKKKAKR